MIEPTYWDEPEGEGDADLAYVPSERVLEGDQDATLELRRIGDGRVAIACYTSLHSLVTCCGDVQPWVSIPRHKLPEVQERSGADLVVWDVELPPDARKDSHDVVNASDQGGEEEESR